MQRMLITGATGLLGANIGVLAAQLYEVFGIARSRKSSPCGSTLIQLDLTDRRSTLRCLQDTQPNVVIHCAAMTDVDRCEEEPETAQLLHLEASRTIAEWAAANDCCFVYISTDSVFDGHKGNYRELDLPNPLNEYARTKLAGEVAVLRANPCALILRTNFYGLSGNSKPGLADWILSQLASGDRVRAFADVYFSPLLASTLARIILELTARGMTGLFHVAARDACSKYEFAVQLTEMFDYRSDRVSPISVDEFPFKARRPKNTSLDVGKVSRLLNREMPTIRDSLREFRKLCEKEPKLISARKSITPAEASLTS